MRRGGPVDNASMQRVTADERRARLVRRHLLEPATRVSSAVEVARAVVAIHSTDPATVFLSIRARTIGLDPSAIERELYEERTVVRMLGMRRTLFLVERALQPIVQTACTDEIAARERTRLEGWIAEAPGIEDPESWLAAAEEAALDAVARAGEASTAELVRATPALATKLAIGSGRWALEASAGSRVLPLLAARGLLVRTRPRGSWISGQYRWSIASTWLGTDLRRPPVEESRAELVRRWLAAHGPGTETDVRWWTGLGARPVRAALAAIGAVDVDLDGATGFVLPGDLEPVEATEPSAALLPTLDSTTMGWKERDWYLGPHASVLFDSNGNAGPTVWWNGRVVGGWSQRADGEIAYGLLEDVGSDATFAIETQADGLREWLGDVRFKPGFLPPFQRELAA
jgi:Winged helix DNA-binding domain